VKEKMEQKTKEQENKAERASEIQNTRHNPKPQTACERRFQVFAKVTVFVPCT